MPPLCCVFPGCLAPWVQPLPSASRECVSGALSAALLGGCSAWNCSLESPALISQELSILLGSSVAPRGFLISFTSVSFLGNLCVPQGGEVEGTDVADVGLS